MSAACRTCGAPIEWAYTEQGKRIPLDAGTAENANLRLDADGVVHYVPAGEGDRVTHFATCLQARAHRRI